MCRLKTHHVRAGAVRRAVNSGTPARRPIWRQELQGAPPGRRAAQRCSDRRSEPNLLPDRRRGRHRSFRRIVPRCRRHIGLRPSRGSSRTRKHSAPVALQWTAILCVELGHVAIIQLCSDNARENDSLDGESNRDRNLKEQSLPTADSTPYADGTICSIPRSIAPPSGRYAVSSAIGFTSGTRLRRGQATGTTEAGVEHQSEASRSKS
jgi:hypothetical protein